MGNNMANSLIVGGLTVGMEVACAVPENYWPDPSVLEFAKEVFWLLHFGRYLCGGKGRGCTLYGRLGIYGA